LQDSSASSDPPCFKGFLSVSAVDFAFPITRDVGDSGDHGDSCSPLLAPSADPSPPPLCTPISTQGHPRPPKAEGRSKPIFPVFQGSNLAHFQPCFPVLAVRSAEGRNWKPLGFLANCQLPIASCLFSKIVQLLPFLPGRKTTQFTICSPQGQAQNLAIKRKITSSL
jgi:hypothetical protein